MFIIGNDYNCVRIQAPDRETTIKYGGLGTTHQLAIGARIISNTPYVHKTHSYNWTQLSYPDYEKLVNILMNPVGYIYVYDLLANFSNILPPWFSEPYRLLDTFCPFVVDDKAEIVAHEVDIPNPPYKTLVFKGRKSIGDCETKIVHPLNYDFILKGDFDCGDRFKVVYNLNGREMEIKPGIENHCINTWNDSIGTLSIKNLDNSNNSTAMLKSFRGILRSVDKSYNPLNNHSIGLGTDRLKVVIDSLHITGIEAIKGRHTVSVELEEVWQWD